MILKVLSREMIISKIIAVGAQKHAKGSSVDVTRGGGRICRKCRVYLRKWRWTSEGGDIDGEGRVEIGNEKLEMEVGEGVYGNRE
jgi:hypothetical protein